LSSAAFVILAALLADKADIRIRDVGVNPTRTGVLDILTAMGASIRLENLRDMGEEPVADIRVRSSKLHGIAVEPALVSLAANCASRKATALPPWPPGSVRWVSTSRNPTMVRSCMADSLPGAM
jgi:hypothetical protein